MKYYVSTLKRYLIKRLSAGDEMQESLVYLRKSTTCKVNTLQQLYTQRYKENHRPMLLFSSFQKKFNQGHKDF